MIDANKNVADVSVIVAMVHSYVGDLVFKLFHPGGKVLTMLSRPGLVEGIDDGSNCCGDNADLAIASPIMFRDLGVKDAEAMGNLNTDSLLVVCQGDGACDYKPNHDSGPGLAFSDFDGLTAKGLWKFCVSDAAGGDVGTLDSVTLTVSLQ